MNSIQKTALIVGCGYVGLALRELLFAEGWYVDSIRRTASGPQVLAIDCSRKWKAIRNYDVVFYLVSADSRTPASYELAYVRGVETTLEALKGGRAGRFIFVSSTSVFSENAGGVVDEASQVLSGHFTCDSLLKGEMLAGESGIPAVVVRFSGIYGPGRNRLALMVKEKKATFKKLPFTSNRIHLEDCAGILMHTALLPEPAPLYIGSDCEPAPYNEILKWLCYTLRVHPDDLKIAEDSPAPRNHKSCSSKKIRDSGYQFRVPDYRQGFTKILSSI